MNLHSRGCCWVLKIAIFEGSGFLGLFYWFYFLGRYGIIDDMAEKTVVCAGQDIDVDFVTVFVLKSLLGHAFVTSIDIACLVTVYAH